MDIPIKNVKIEELGKRVIITSNDGCRTTIHFDKDGNQLHTWINTNADTYKTKIHTFKQAGEKYRKTFIFNKSKGWTDKKRIMLFDNK